MFTEISFYIWSVRLIEFSGEIKCFLNDNESTDMLSDIIFYSNFEFALPSFTVIIFFYRQISTALLCLFCSLNVRGHKDGNGMYITTVTNNTRPTAFKKVDKIHQTEVVKAILDSDKFSSKQS